MVEMVFDVILDVFEVYISDVVSISNFGPKLGNSRAALETTFLPFSDAIRLV